MGQVIPFPRDRRLPKIEIFERNRSWVAMIEPEPSGVQLSGEFKTRFEALAYAEGLHNATGWLVLDWQDPSTGDAA